MKRIGLSFVVLLFLAGCSLQTSMETLTDEYTTADIPTIETISQEMFLYHHNYDNMDRGNHDYTEKALVIESLVEGFKISRGDVIFYHNENGEKDISRIIALPGEKIKITGGQVYINSQKLDAFYGFAHRLGLDKDRYFEMMDEAGNQYNKNGMREYFETNMEQIKLASDEYYLIDDDWMRGKMRVIKEQDIVGFVLGYTE